MTTSGTVAQTVLDTATVLEHAFRRCKVHPSKQTPEKIDLAKQSLYMLLTNLSNRGLNLWTIEKIIVGIQSGKALYQCPAGTIDLLNLVYSQATQITGTDSTTATDYITQLTTATSVSRIGLKLTSVTASDTLTLSYSTDGVTYTTILTETKTDWTTDEWYWFDVPVVSSQVYYKASFGSAATFGEFYLASTIVDLPVTQWSRDTFSVINNKSALGRPSTCYYFEKLINPQVTLWPVPNNHYDQLSMFVHRQIEDVGTLTQTLAIPARWYEAVVWELALRLAFELEEVTPDVLQTVSAACEKYGLDAADEETDGAPLYLTPQIGVYNR